MLWGRWVPQNLMHVYPHTARCGRRRFHRPDGGGPEEARLRRGLRHQLRGGLDGTRRKRGSLYVCDCCMRPLRHSNTYTHTLRLARSLALPFPHTLQHTNTNINTIKDHGGGLGAPRPRERRARRGPPAHVHLLLPRYDWFGGGFVPTALGLLCVRVTLDVHRQINPTRKFKNRSTSN